MQDDTHVTNISLESKPEVEFQYGDRAFSETASSYISAVVWDTLTKFGILIDFHHLQRVPSLTLKQE